MKKRIAILGCGPSGLLAAHAAQMRGVSFDIFSKRRKSYLFGSQYLHNPIPEVPTRSAQIIYETVGTPEEYRRKCHGDAWDGQVAPEEFETHHTGWDIRQAYDHLWEMYDDSIYNLEIDGRVQNLDSHIHLGNYGLVISTLPRKIWSTAHSGEKFVSSKAWALGDAPELGQRVPFPTPEDNRIICDGTWDHTWYRLSRVFGYTTVEWPHHHRPPLPNLAEVERPLQYIPGPDGNPADQFLHLGRYGEWKKGVLATDVFDQAYKAIGEL